MQQVLQPKAQSSSSREDSRGRPALSVSALSQVLFSESSFEEAFADPFFREEQRHRREYERERRQRQRSQADEDFSVGISVTPTRQSVFSNYISMY